MKHKLLKSIFAAPLLGIMSLAAFSIISCAGTASATTQDSFKKNPVRACENLKHTINKESAKITRIARAGRKVPAASKAKLKASKRLHARSCGTVCGNTTERDCNLKTQENPDGADFCMAVITPIQFANIRELKKAGARFLNRGACVL